MTTQTKSKNILSLIFGAFIVFAVLEIVVAHSFQMLTMLGILGGFVLLTYPLGRWARSFKKLMESLPADYKYVTKDLAAIDIGNFRFIYQVYEKGNGANPFSKSFISMAVGIPFPKGKEEVVLDALSHLLEELQSEGSLTEYNPIHFVDNNPEDTNKIQTTWLGRYFRLEYPLKSMTSSRLSSLQERILAIVDKFQLQDVSWCIMKGRNYGTNYYYFQGNLLQNTVLLKDSFDRKRSDYRQCAEMCITEFENLFDTGKYLNLYQLASRDLGKEELHLSDVVKLTKQLFKGTRKSVAKISDSDESVAVVITIPKQRAASTYYLKRSGDRWWIHAQGRLENIDPISADNESSACDLFLRILSKYPSLRSE